MNSWTDWFMGGVDYAKYVDVRPKLFNFYPDNAYLIKRKGVRQMKVELFKNQDSTHCYDDKLMITIARANELASMRGTRVYGSDARGWTSEPYDGDTMTALLVDITPISEMDTLESLVREQVNAGAGDIISQNWIDRVRIVLERK